MNGAIYYRENEMSLNVCGSVIEDNTDEEGVESGQPAAIGCRRAKPNRFDDELVDCGSLRLAIACPSQR